MRIKWIKTYEAFGRQVLARSKYSVDISHSPLPFLLTPPSCYHTIIISVVPQSWAMSLLYQLAKDSSLHIAEDSYSGVLGGNILFSHDLF